MITWIQKTFHEHFRFVFIALLVVSIIAFIFINNTSIGLGLFRAQVEKRPFFGINLAESRALERIQKDAIISVFFQFGSIPPKNEHLQQLAMKRHALVYTANQLRLPHPPGNEIKNRIKTLRYFKDAHGKYDDSRYLHFQVSPKIGTGMDMTFDDFLRVMSDDLRIEHLQTLISGPGYVMPREVRNIIRQNEATWTLISAGVDFKNALKPVDADESHIKGYFEANRQKYAIAPQVRVDYIEFPSSLFLSAVSVTEDEVRAYYDANPARFPKSMTIAGAPQSHDQGYELVRPNAEALLRQQRAQALAATSASELALALDRGGILPGTPEFDEFLKKNQVSAKPLPAFSRESPPAQFGRHAAAMAKEGFSLNAEARYSNPVTINQGAAILVWQESIPGRPAEFSEVAEKVKDDYINEEQQKQIQVVGKRIKQQVETDLKEGFPFQVAITRAAVGEGAGVTTKNHSPFSLRQRDARRQGGRNAPGIDRDIMNALWHLDQGQLSNMTIVGHAGKFVYAQNVKYPDLTEANPEYVRIGNDMAVRRANSAFDAYVQDLVDTELEKANKNSKH
ncbi:peptidylprolyl isomerase [Ereboglobus luteus]|uniref:PpiC domain-containing protein n=1 Tax=Ereboglobus luteus TaxID=1796921 RepID=A0A2U8E0F0_9BACT|nr:peptidylprolyl isomerase [Ereboglobus luteus]AWI08318.1 hypothetical protein CKA38_02755 [Ereboglobus luteus]